MTFVFAEFRLNNNYRELLGVNGSYWELMDDSIA